MPLPHRAVAAASHESSGSGATCWTAADMARSKFVTADHVVHEGVHVVTSGHQHHRLTSDLDSPLRTHHARMPHEAATEESKRRRNLLVLNETTDTYLPTPVHGYACLNATRPPVGRKTDEGAARLNTGNLGQNRRASLHFSTY